MNKKLLFLLVLLLTATTGAWAQEPVDGTIAWSVGNEASATVSASIKDAISSTGVTTGSGLTVSTCKYFDTNMMKYQPATANAGNVSGVMIEYTIEAVDGYKFKPTGVDYAAVKDGTDNASYSWSYTIDGVESAITDVSMNDVLRSSGSNSATAQLMHSESITADGCSVFTLRFYISNCSNTKKICIGNITISGSVSAAASSGYTVSLKNGVKDADKWTVKAGTDGSFQSLPLKGVKAGTKVKLKYDGDRSMLKGVTAMKVAKKAAYEHSITIAVDPRTTEPKATAPAMTIEFNTGETWANVAARYDWLDTYETYTVFYKDDKLNGNVYDANGGVTPDKTIDPNGSYHWGPQ